MALDRRHVAAHRGEDRRLVSGARPDLEDPVARPRREQLAHPGHDERLTDRLPRLDRECLVGVRVVPLPLGPGRLRAARWPLRRARARPRYPARGAAWRPSRLGPPRGPPARRSWLERYASAFLGTPQTGGAERSGRCGRSAPRRRRGGGRRRALGRRRGRSRWAACRALGRRCGRGSRRTDCRALGHDRRLRGDRRQDAATPADDAVEQDQHEDHGDRDHEPLRDVVAIVDGQLGRRCCPLRRGGFRAVRRRCGDGWSGGSGSASRVSRLGLFGVLVLVREVAVVLAFGRDVFGLGLERLLRRRPASAASGSVASGSVASGSVASGSVASGTGSSGVPGCRSVIW